MLIKYPRFILLINIPISLAIRVSSYASNAETPSNESTLLERNNLNLYSHKKDYRSVLKILPEKRRANKHESWPDMPSPYLEPPKLIKSSQKKTVRKKKLKNSNYGANIGEENGSERPVYVRDHAPTQLHQQHDSSNVKKKQKISGENKNAIQFHIHGHQGPDSYIFGYDTGLGNNRQFRLEERHKNGTVTGHYGYYDSRGKLRKVHYSAQPSVEFDDSHTNSHSGAR